MKAIFFLAIVLFPCFAISQKKYETTDSLRYYSTQLRKLTRQVHDSLRKSEQYISLLSDMARLRKGSLNYDGVVFSGELMHSGYEKLNQSINKDSFPNLNAFTYRFGFGLAYKKGRRIFNFHFATIGVNSKSDKGNQKIKAGLSNLFQFNWGYDLLKSKAISIYPYAGFSMRMSMLSYSKPVLLNTGYTNLTNLITNEQSVVLSSAKLGYELGACVDVFLTKTRDVAFFTKVATSSAFGKNNYKIHSVKYDPGIKQGDWLVGIGIKFLSASY